MTSSHRTANLFLKISGTVRHTNFMILDGVKQDMHLEKPWLTTTNPIIDWKKGRIKCQIPDGKTFIIKSVWVLWRMLELKKNKKNLVPKKYKTYFNLFDTVRKYLSKHIKWDYTIPLEKNQQKMRLRIFGKKAKKIQKLHQKEFGKRVYFTFRIPNWSFNFFC